MNLMGPTRSGSQLVLTLGLAFWLMITPGGGAHAQRAKPGGYGDTQSGVTVLNADFAKKLADPELNFPDDEALTAVEGRDTDYARYDACRWQEIVLTRPFAAAACRGCNTSYGQGQEFTAGLSAGGYDSVYYRWETDLAGLPGAADYCLQFRCTRWLLSVAAEPKSPATREPLSKEQVKARAATAVTDIVNCGPQLLMHSTMRLEPMPYGYRIWFDQTPEQTQALHDEKRARVYAIGYDAGDEWLRLL